MNMRSHVELVLRSKMAIEHMEVGDDSDEHAGHAGSSGGGHFVVLVVSPSFEGKSLVDRQRSVMALFDAELRSGAIHAMALTTRTPSEWAGASKR